MTVRCLLRDRLELAGQQVGLRARVVSRVFAGRHRILIRLDERALVRLVWMKGHTG